MLEELRKGLQGTLREAALLAEIERLRESIEGTEQTLAAEKHRLEQLVKELQKERGPLARLYESRTPGAIARAVQGEGSEKVSGTLRLSRKVPDTFSAPRPAAAHAPVARGGPVPRAPGPAAPAAAVRQAAQSAFQAAASAVLGAKAPQVAEFVHTLGLAEPRIVPPAEAAAEHEESPAAAPAAETPPAHEAAHEVAAGGAREAVAEAAPEAASEAADETAEEAAHEAAAAAAAGRAAEAGPHDELAAHEKRLVEALDTGRSALARLDRCVTLVQDLARAGVWRVAKGLVLSRSPARQGDAVASPEHAKMDEARRAAHEAQELLRSFQDQVHALRHEFGESVEAPDLADFAGHFARSLVSGSPDEAHGHLAAESARAAYHDVRRVCARLQLDAIALRAKRAAVRRLGRRG
jgi:chemotaxis protein histidine kinase CheA